MGRKVLETSRGALAAFGCFDRTVCAQATFRVWDMLFLEGSAVLLRTGLAIFR